MASPVVSLTCTVGIFLVILCLQKDKEEKENFVLKQKIKAEEEERIRLKLVIGHERPFEMLILSSHTAKP